jgi:enamine deaminase RidA (YjgF/YER057c/UK114 family)
MDPATGQVAGDLGKQFGLMAQAHIDTLSAAGLRLEDIVSGTVYLRDIDDYKPFNDLYAGYYSKGPGVRTCLMPNSGYEKNEVRMRASFIAARSQ